MCICPACKALGHHFVWCTSFIAASWGLGCRRTSMHNTFGKGGSSRISRVMSETDEDEFSFHMNVEFWKNDPCKSQLHFATFDSDRPPWQVSCPPAVYKTESRKALEKSEERKPVTFLISEASSAHVLRSLWALRCLHHLQSSRNALYFDLLDLCVPEFKQLWFAPVLELLVFSHLQDHWHAARLWCWLARQVAPSDLIVESTLSTSFSSVVGTLTPLLTNLACGNRSWWSWWFWSSVFCSPQKLDKLLKIIMSSLPYEQEGQVVLPLLVSLCLQSPEIVTHQGPKDQITQHHTTMTVWLSDCP